MRACATRVTGRAACTCARVPKKVVTCHTCKTRVHTCAHAKCTFSRVICHFTCKRCTFSVCQFVAKMHMPHAHVCHTCHKRVRVHMRTCAKKYVHMLHVQNSCAHVRACKMHVFTCNLHFYMQNVLFQRVPYVRKNANATCARVPHVSQSRPRAHAHVCQKICSHVTRAKLMCTRARMQNARFHV